jgi:glyoxylase-like metal-dependent hydrolase (beta-lactamase superfamily II)
MSDTAFDREFLPAYGMAVPVAPKVQRITVNNPSPFTFHGTNSYIVGDKSVAVIDPGPIDEAHLEALMAALKGREVTHIFVSHTHKDHAPLAAQLKARTGAITIGQGPHRSARPLHHGESNPFAESSDMDFVPDIAAEHGQLIEGDGWALRTLHTPGHTANHACFALEGTGITFSADHIMAWATTIVAPPDGSMSDFMASLEVMLEREDQMLLPGHGGPVNDPNAFMRGLRAHRKMREMAVLRRIKAGDHQIADIVKVIYRNTDKRLHGAAALSVLAHIEDLIAKGAVETEGPPSLQSLYVSKA